MPPELAYVLERDEAELLTSRPPLRVVEFEPEVDIPTSAVPIQPELAGRTSRKERIKNLEFNRFTGSLLLQLNAKKVLTQSLSQRQVTELKANCFRPYDNLHITAINTRNGSRIINALGGQRRRLAGIEGEASVIDWSWSSKREFYSLRGKRGGSLMVGMLVDCPGRDELYDLLEERLEGLELDRDPLHISLMRRRGSYRDPRQTVIGGIAVGQPLRDLNELATSPR